MSKPVLPIMLYAKTKAQISCAVTMQLNSVPLFSPCLKIVNSSKSENFKSLSIFCSYTARFVSDLHRYVCLLFCFCFFFFFFFFFFKGACYREKKIS